jgi:hypothetical protein
MRGYYYCSLNTFLSIIKNKQIYLSDPLKMNDNLELKWYLDRLNNEQFTVDKVDYQESIFDMVKKRSGLNFTFEELVEILNSKGQKSVYISCFSREPDILSQWRAYAEDGRGVSIGFNLDMLKKADNFFVSEVIYTDDVVYGSNESGIEIVADTINIVFSVNKIAGKEEQMEVFLHELIPELIQYKNPSFIEEQEIRLVYCEDMKFEKILDRNGAFREKWNYIELEHDFRTIGSDNITEFVKLDFCLNAIEEICIGPKCLLSRNDVKNIMNRLLDIDVNIIESKSSYR